MSEKDMAVLAALAGFAWWTYVFLASGLFPYLRTGYLVDVVPDK
jgi:hypothetical protein